MQKANVCEPEKTMGRLGTPISVIAGVVVGLVILPAVAAGQDTRAGEITRKQEEKAASEAPYTPTTFERVMTSIESGFVSPPSGVFPFFDSVYSGGGFTLGAGYRHFYARESVWEIKGLYSIKNYKLIEVGTRSPWNNSARWTKGIRFGWRDAPQVGYYGTGIDSVKDDRANFRMKQTYLVGDVVVRPSSWTRVSAEVAYDDYRNEEGQGKYASIETAYDASTAPGLFQHLTYIRSQGTAAIDWRVSPGYSRTGGFYGVTFADFSDRDKTYSFRRVDGEVIQHVPILRETWVLSFRGRVQSGRSMTTTHVPYYPAALAREREHAARVFDGAVPRSQLAADVGGVPLDSRVAWRSTWRSSTTPAKWPAAGRTSISTA